MEEDKKNNITAVQYNLETGEYFLKLPPPFDNIILTTARAGSTADEEIVVKALNDPRVYEHFENRLPYLPEHASAFLKRSAADDERIFGQLNAATAGSDVYADGSPLKFIREIKSDGRDTLIGVAGFSRYSFYELPPDSEEKNQAKEQNFSFPPGDPRIIWSAAFWLIPTHQRRGIMSAALSCVIEGWMRPRVNARILKGTAYVENEGSIKVLKNVGFEVEHRIEDGAVVPDSRGGGRRSIYVLKKVL